MLERQLALLHVLNQDLSCARVSVSTAKRKNEREGERTKEEAPAEGANLVGGDGRAASGEAQDKRPLGGGRELGNTSLDKGRHPLRCSRSVLRDHKTHCIVNLNSHSP